MGSAQVRLAWTSPTLTSCFKQSEPNSPPSPLTTPTCLTRSSTRRRKCPKEMETSSRPDRKLKRESWTSSCESTSTNGGSSEPRKRRRKPRKRKRKGSDWRRQKRKDRP